MPQLILRKFPAHANRASPSVQGFMSSYHPRSLERLELPLVLARLENNCASALGIERVRELQPTNDASHARARLAFTSEALKFAQTGKFPPFGGVSDVSDAIQRAAIGSVLDAEPLLKISRAAEGVRRLREVIRGVDEDLKPQFPLLLELVDEITPRVDIEKAINGAIDDQAEIKDDASLELLRARRGIRLAQTQIQTRLRAMIGDSRLQGHLQDAFVTVRDGRYCIPVKAESRAAVPGIVHDRSGSGNALFIEPQAVVELNNRLRELAGEEKVAVDAILRALSGLVGGAADDLNRGLEAAGDLDFAFAKAQLSLQMDALEPEVRDDFSGWNLVRARHPLVEGCVANDIRLGENSAVTERGDFDVMMLTGPNTGGKTVVLKTIGLLSSMIGCGLHIPVDKGSWLGLPGQIHVDIGDEQSIEQSLSTFSGHLKNIVGILKTVGAGDLVLFDEIGAGTDPDEGAALAKAVLRTLQRRGAKVVATTHYGELKQFALSAMRFENASVEFDAVSLRPTYRLRIGVPGASNALDIAARLGMPPELIQRARKYIGRERLESEAAAQRLDEVQRELESQTEAARLERTQLEKLKRDYEGRLARVASENEREIARAKREAKELVDRATREADAALRELRQASQATKSSPSENKGTEQARGRLRTLRERVNAFGDGAGTPERETKFLEILNPVRADAPSPFPTASSTFKIGDIALVKSFNKEGEILGISGDRAEMRLGAMKVAVKLSELEPSRQSARTGGMAAIQSRKSWNVDEEINLIGQDVESALDEVEKYLDDATLAGKKQVRIVHGRGTGALRSAIHRFLSTVRAVKGYELASQGEGGEGATVVSLG